LPLPAVGREQFALENGLDAAKTWIGLLPGSRAKEIQDHLPEMLKAARLLAADLSNGVAETAGFEFVVPLAATLGAEQEAEARRLVEKHGAGLTVRLTRDARATLRHARASVVASGTATVEAALMGNPFVVVYRVSPLTYALAQRMVKVPHVAMANLIAGKRVVPELIQKDFTAANIVQHLEPLLPDGQARESMKKELGLIREALAGGRRAGAENGMGAVERVAAVILEELEAVGMPKAAGAGTAGMRG
jgi:lipid-A-disaccharide synthase